MDLKQKKYIIAGVAVAALVVGGVCGYLAMRPEPELPYVYEDPIQESKLTPEELEELKKEEEKVHTDEHAVPLEEGALEGNPENDTPDIDKTALEIEKTAEADLKEVHDKQQEMLNSGELVVGEKTDIENGVIAKEDVVEYSEQDDVLKEVNYSTEKAVQDITKALGPGGAEHFAIEGNYEQKDWDQLVNNPYSSESLGYEFDAYKKYGDLESFKAGVVAWLLNGGDDGVAHAEVFG